MGTNSIQAQVKDGWKLLETRKKQLESAKAQTKAVQDEYSKIKKDQGNAEQLDAKLAQKIMILSNFTVKTEPKEPAKVEDPGNAPNIPADATEKEKGTIRRDFEQKKADFKQYQEAVKQYEKDLKEFKKYEALKTEIETESPAIKGQLDTLMKAAQTKEDELKKAQGEEAELQREVDFSWDNYQDLQKELESAKFEVKLDKKGDNLTSVAKENINNTSIDGKQADVKTVYKGILEGDKENKVDNTKKHYTTMNVGDKHTYTKDQIARMGADVDLTDDFVGDNFSTEMNDLLNGAVDKSEAKQSEQPVQPAKDKPEEKEIKAGKDGEITLPRGLDMRVGINDGSGVDRETNGKKADSLNDYGIVEVDGKYYRAKKGEDGKLVSRDDRAFTADEVNEYFRGIEQDVKDEETAKNKAEKKYATEIDKYSINTKNMTADEIKAAVKAAKARTKYATEIDKYSINTENMTADQIKAAVKAAKKGPKPDKMPAKSNADKPGTITPQSSASQSAFGDIDVDGGDDPLAKLDEKGDAALGQKDNEFGQIVKSRIDEAKAGSSIKLNDDRYTVRLTNDNKKVLELNGEFYEVDDKGNVKKTNLSKNDIKPSEI